LIFGDPPSKFNFLEVTPLSYHYFFWCPPCKNHQPTPPDKKLTVPYENLSHVSVIDQHKGLETILDLLTGIT
jgi:hypothetical protein